MLYNHLEKQDSELFATILKEEKRQENELELIASENYASPAVMEAMATVLANKYSEGYPGKRYTRRRALDQEAQVYWLCFCLG